MSMPVPSSVDEYLERVSPESARLTLTKLRATIREAIPEAEEVIKYGMPTYQFQGFIASFAAYKKHCSFFPGHTVADFSGALTGYKTSKGTIQFPHDKPLPDTLVIAIVQARFAENESQSTS
jgi:uncharacterized protein YdhG (YjbR/CyaY superfamily)